VPAARFAVLEARRAGCQSIAVLTRENQLAAAVRNHLDRNGLRPVQLGAGEVLETSMGLSEDLPSMTSRELAERVLDLVASFVPTCDRRIIQQARGRLGDAGARRDRAGPLAGSLLDAVAPLYEEETAAFFGAVVEAVDAVRKAGHHVPQPDELALYEAVSRSGERDRERQLNIFNARLAAWSHASRQEEKGITVMTAHQAKGREFDAVVLVGANRRHFPSGDDEERRLFYVAITRGVRRWSVIAQRGEMTEYAQAL
jgi:superfamily I DNA/RNA helicase